MRPGARSIDVLNVKWSYAKPATRSSLATASFAPHHFKNCKMTRNPNAFTARQIRFLEAVRERIREINDPDPEIITNESYEFSIEQTKQFGRIPKIRFRPNSCQIKAELIEKAGLVDEARQNQISIIRQKYGIRKARNGLANLFESEWNNIMFKAKKAAFTLAFINQRFSAASQRVADPIDALQQIIMAEHTSQIQEGNPQIKCNEIGKDPLEGGGETFMPYDEELRKMESWEVKE